MSITWYFDFISPFAYLQYPKVRTLAATQPVTLKPVLLAGLLKHHGQKGPAETPGKREFTYRHVMWRARAAGRPLCFPPAHPFNPLAALRLCIAAGSTIDAAAAIFEWIYAEGNSGNSAEALQAVALKLGVPDPVSAIVSPEVKAKLKANFETAISDGVFGVPTLLLDGHLFWGDDAHDFALACLQNPSLWHHPEMRRADTLPMGVGRYRPQSGAE